MARIDWIEQRLQVWARWVLTRGGGGVLGYAGVNLADSDAGRSGYASAAVPLLEAEAADTDAAVQQLTPTGLRLTVAEYYAGRGGIADKAARLCCAEATVYARLDQAHRQLAAHFVALSARRKEERARVEALQQQARQRLQGVDR